MAHDRVISAVRRPLRKEHGFSFMELMIAALIIAILVALVILFVTGFFGEARETGMESELRNMKTAVGAYIIQAFEWPTEDGNAPLPGEYALIDFGASFMQDGQVRSFYPHFIENRPKHWDEDVWRLDSAARVSLDMDPEEY